MYLNDPRLMSFGFGQVPSQTPRLQPRCSSHLFTIPGSLGELEQAVKGWISTCVRSRTEVRGVPAHREYELVTGNQSLLDIWTNILRHRVGQRIEIRADYVWSQNRVESVRFSTLALPPTRPTPRPTQPPPGPRQLPQAPRAHRPYPGSTTEDALIEASRPTIGPARPQSEYDRAEARELDRLYTRAQDGDSNAADQLARGVNRLFADRNRLERVSRNLREMRSPAAIILVVPPEPAPTLDPRLRLRVPQRPAPRR